MGSSITPIHSLLMPGGPAAVAWLVIAVHIYAVKCGLWRTGPHIGVEIGEVLFPSLAYCYAATAVILISMIALALTSRQHGCPRVVFARIGHVMSGKSGNRGFSRVAAAACRPSGCDVPLAGDNRIAAVAEKFPEMMRPAKLTKSNSSQSPKLLPGNVCGCRETTARFGVAIPKIFGRDRRLRPAVALTHPINTAPDIGGTLDHCQATVSMAEHVYELRHRRNCSSKWYTQVQPSRSRRIVKMMREG